jgi:ABC-type glycerol-3-phosphate transport system permease component
MTDFAVPIVIALPIAAALAWLLRPVIAAIMAVALALLFAVSLGYTISHLAVPGADALRPGDMSRALGEPIRP